MRAPLERGGQGVPGIPCSRIGPPGGARALGRAPRIRPGDPVLTQQEGASSSASSLPSHFQTGAGRARAC